MFDVDGNRLALNPFNVDPLALNRPGGSLLLDYPALHSLVEYWQLIMWRLNIDA